MQNKYRHLILKEPLLYDDLLPTEWPKELVNMVFQNIYEKVKDETDELIATFLIYSENTLKKSQPWKFDLMN